MDMENYQAPGGGYQQQQHFNYGGGGSNIPPAAGDQAIALVTAPADDEENHYINGIRESEYFDSLPSGFRFEPHDQELILDYLKKRINNEKLPHNLIKLVNLYEQGPLDLTARFRELGENIWYFFTPRDRKYQNGSRPNRAAGNGYWKATGKDKAIGYRGRVIGSRKALVFYNGTPKDSSAKTNWSMHEYVFSEPSSKRVRTSMADMRLDDYVLCKIIRKPIKANKNKTRRVVGKRGFDGVNGVGVGESISNDGAGTSSNNNNNSEEEEEENQQMHLAVNNDQIEVDSNWQQQQLMIKEEEDEVKIQVAPPPPPPMDYYPPYNYQQPQPQPQPMMNDARNMAAEAVPSVYEQEEIINWKNQEYMDSYYWEIQNNINLCPFPELENIFQYPTPSPNPYPNFSQF